MQALVIPSIFTAVDKYSGPVGTMGTATQNFNNRLEALNSRSEKLFKKFTPGLNEASKQFLSFASAAAVAAGVVATARFSANGIMEYEDALQSFRTIVSNLTDKDFVKFEKAIGNIANESKKSTIEVAQAFEKIAGLNSTFAESTEQISEVTKAVITLSRASRDDLGTSAQNLVGILNQFSLGAEQSDRAINALAAGQAVGAASISQTAEAFTVFGAVAKQSNLTLEQSVALTEVLASKQILGSEAGTALRGTLVRLKASGLGYQSGLFDTRDALIEVNKQYGALKTAKEKDALLDKVFGTINLTTGSILMNSIKMYDDYTVAVTNTSEAHKAAEINANTLSERVRNLGATWINLLTTNESVGSGLNQVKDALKFVTDNMSQIVSVGVTVIEFFALWKASILLTKAYMVGYNVVFGINNALQQRSLFYTEGNTIAKYADLAVTKAITAATWLWNEALAANPIALAIMAVAALALGIGILIKENNYLTEKYKEQQKLKIEQSKKSEADAIDRLVKSYRDLGYSISEATAKSLALERQNIKSEQSSLALEIAKNKKTIDQNTLIKGGAIFSDFSSEKSEAVEQLSKNKARELVLANKYAMLTEKSVGFMNAGIVSKDKMKEVFSQPIAKTTSNLSIEQLRSEQIEKNRIAQVVKLQEEGGFKPSINPKLAQASITKTINSNSTSNTTVTFKNETNNSAIINSENKSSSLMPGMTSTTSIPAK